MIPEVKKCGAHQCFYNRNDECYANAVLVGSSEPVCETFTESNQHTNKDGQSEVGACHINNCVYNDNMFCHSCNDIEVKWNQDSAMCATYRAK